MGFTPAHVLGSSDASRSFTAAVNKFSIIKGRRGQRCVLKKGRERDVGSSMTQECHPHKQGASGKQSQAAWAEAPHGSSCSKCYHIIFFPTDWLTGKAPLLQSAKQGSVCPADATMKHQRAAPARTPLPAAGICQGGIRTGNPASTLCTCRCTQENPCWKRGPLLPLCKQGCPRGIAMGHCTTHTEGRPRITTTPRRRTSRCAHASPGRAGAWWVPV